MIDGTVLAACGVAWYSSRVRTGNDQDRELACVWIGGFGQRKDRKTHPDSRGDIGDPPAGFSLHLPDFTGP